MSSSCWAWREAAACRVPDLAPAAAAAGTLFLFRYADYDTPFWDRPNSRPGRWHRVGDPPTQYWSMTPEGAWAELIRFEELTNEAELDLVRKPIWACRVTSRMAVDLRAPKQRKRHDILERALIDDDHAACQDLGAELRDSGCQLVLSPSAALDGHTNVTMFGARRMSDWRLRAPLARTLPATEVALGRPPEGLLARVRRRTRGAGCGPA